MKRIFKSILSLVMVLSLVVAGSGICMAKTIDSGNSVISANKENQSTKSILGMKQFLQKSIKGTILFDTEGAKKAGYSEEAISAVQAHISTMNSFVIAGSAYIDDNFTETIYISSTQAQGSIRATLAQGETKVVTHWYGLTEVYMNSDDTTSFINNLSRVGDVFTMASAISLFPSKVTAVLSGMITVMSIQNTFYRWQAEAAAGSGTGIIMNIYPDATTGDPTFWFVSQ